MDMSLDVRSIHTSIFSPNAPYIYGQWVINIYHSGRKCKDRLDTNMSIKWSSCFPPEYYLVVEIWRGTIVNRTYGTHKNLPGTYLPIFTNSIWSYLLWSPVIVYIPGCIVPGNNYRREKKNSLIASAVLHRYHRKKIPPTLPPPPSYSRREMVATRGETGGWG